MAAVVGSVAVQIVPSAKGFTSKLKAVLLPEADKLGTEIGQRIGARIREALGLEMRNLPGGTVNIDADTGKAETQIAALGAEAKALGTESPTIRPKVDSGPALAEIGSIRAAMLGLTAIAAAPLLSSAAGGAGALLGPLTGGLIGGIGLIAAAKPSLDNVTKALAAQKKAWDGTQKSQEAYVAALRNLSPVEQAMLPVVKQLKDAFALWQGQLQPTVLDLLTGAVSLLTNVLTLVQPIVRAVGAALTQFEDVASQTFGSPMWQMFGTEISMIVGPALQGIGQIILNLLSAFAGLTVAFAPLTQRIVSGLVSITQQFANFATNAGSNSGFQNFISFVITQGPAVMAALASVAGAIGHLITALAPLGVVVLGGLKFLADVIQSMPVGVIQGLAVVILSLIGVLRTLAAVTAILDVAMDANPIGLVILAIAGLVAVVVAAYTHFQGFRDAVTAVFDAIKESASAVADFFTKDIPEAFNATMAAGKAAVDAVEGAWSAMIGFVAAIPGRIASVASGMFDGIKNAAEGAIEWVQQRFEDLLQFIQSIPDRLTGGLSRLGNDLLPGSPFGMAEGGVVNPRPGGTIVRLAEAGRPEAVVPLDRASDFGGGSDLAAEIRGLRSDVRNLARQTGAAVGDALNTATARDVRTSRQLIRQGAYA